MTAKGGAGILTALKPNIVSSFLFLTLCSLGGISFLFGSVNKCYFVPCLSKMDCTGKSSFLLPLLHITPKVLCVGEIKARKICKLILHGPYHISPEAIKQKVSDQFKQVEEMGKKCRESKRNLKTVCSHKSQWGTTVK